MSIETCEQPTRWPTIEGLYEVSAHGRDDFRSGREGLTDCGITMIPTDTLHLELVDKGLGWNHFGYEYEESLDATRECWTRLIHRDFWRPSTYVEIDTKWAISVRLTSGFAILSS